MLDAVYGAMESLAAMCEDGPPPKRQRVTDESSYEVFDGFISRGGDLLSEWTDVQAAKEKALELEGCQGFTFKGPDEGRVYVYFKNKWDNTPNKWDVGDEDRWTSYKIVGDEDVGEEVPPAPAPSGKKVAVLVGINYFNSRGELGGCINDAHCHRSILIEHFGFDESNIKMLTDAPESGEESRPTAENIRAAITEMMDRAEDGDMLFFAYSGHGSQWKNADGSEEDRMDECICPIDCLSNPWPEYVILDNWFHSELYGRLPQGAILVSAFDCCHSGTVVDLTVTRELCAPGEGDEIKNRFLPPPPEAEHMKELLELPRSCGVAAQRRREATQGKRVFVFSGCRDDQTSADATIGGQRRGAMTWAMAECLQEAEYSISYEDLIDRMRQKMARRFEQVPQLQACSEDGISHMHLRN